MSRTPPPSAARTLATLFGALAAAYATAQTPPPVNPGAVDRAGDGSAPTVANAVPLAEQPVRFDALGLSIRLPTDVVVETTSLGVARQTVSVRPTDGAWRVVIADQISRNTAMTTRELMTQIIENIVAQRPRQSIDPKTGKPLGGDVEVLDRYEPLEINGMGASRAYIGMRGVDESVLVEGYTLFRTEPGRFVLIKLEAAAADYARARPVYEAICATAHFPDAFQVASDRTTALLAGDNLMRSLSREDYLAALPDEPEWRRIFRPGQGGRADEEVAYQRIEMRLGYRGELNRQKPRSSWNAADLDEGLVVRVAARYLDGGRVIDSESIYFATLAGDETDEESWSVRMSIRDRNDESIWMETGVRRGSRLSVRVAPPAGEPTEKTWMTPDRGYITQVDTYLLPRLLARTGAPLIFGFYAYNSASGEISLRRDTLEPAATRAGEWTLRTRMGEGAADRVAALGSRGEVLRVELPDGTVMERTTPERLQALWKSKGLPTN